jgi:hypothetical protein
MAEDKGRAPTRTLSAQHGPRRGPDHDVRFSTGQQDGKLRLAISREERKLQVIIFCWVWWPKHTQRHVPTSHIAYRIRVWLAAFAMAASCYLLLIPVRGYLVAWLVRSNSWFSQGKRPMRTNLTFRSPCAHSSGRHAWTSHICLWRPVQTAMREQP